MNKQKFQLLSQSLDVFGRFLAQLPMWTAICIVVFFIHKDILALAGKETIAQFGFFLLADLRASKLFSHIVSWAVGLVGTTYGIRERNLRRRSISRITAHGIEVEKKLDPGRSSSHLTTKGTTRKEDRQ